MSKSSINLFTVLLKDKQSVTDEMDEISDIVTPCELPTDTSVVPADSTPCSLVQQDALVQQKPDILTADDLIIFALCAGYSAKWTKSNPDAADGELSLSDQFGHFYVGRTSSSVLAWAILATCDDLIEKCKTDATVIPIAKAILLVWNR